MRDARHQAAVHRYPDPFSQEVVDAIKAHAAQCYPLESVGFVTEEGYVACENVHETPDTNFRVDPAVSRAIMERTKVLALVHSHPDGPNFPSFMDQQVQIESGLTWGIVPVIGTNVGDDIVPVPSDILWWGDALPIPPLERRRFIWGIFHCWSLYRHWFKLNRGIWLPNFACPVDFINDGVSIFMDNFEKAGLRNLGKIDMCDLQIGDMLVGHVKGQFPNHCGVYVGGDDMLHHLDTGISRPDQLVRWWPRVDAVFRYDEGRHAASLRGTG